MLWSTGPVATELTIGLTSEPKGLTRCGSIFDPALERYSNHCINDGEDLEHTITRRHNI
jgi:hypothetical protein